MKIGEKIVCIKSRNVFNLKGKTYEILQLYKIDNTINVSLEAESERIYGYCAFQLHLIEDCDHYNKYLFQDHFITQQEYRKQKIKKLNEYR